MWRSEQSASVPGQSLAPFRLPRVSVDTGRGNVLFESVQMGSELLDLLLDVFEFLQESMSVVCGGHQMDRYLVMLDESVHSTEGGFEGREPIGGLFRDIKEDLHAIDDSLPLYYEVQTVKEFTRQKALDQLTSTRISVAPGGPGVRQTSFLEHDCGGQISSAVRATKPDTATVLRCGYCMGYVSIDEYTPGLFETTDLTSIEG